MTSHNGHTENVKMLLEKGAKPDFMETDGTKEFLLHQKIRSWTL